jgi:hypothetical protein
MIYRHIVVQYSIRDEEGGRDPFARRLISLVLRWRPENRVLEADGRPPEGVRVLHDLDQGQAVRPDRMDTLTVYLREAAAYYRSNPPEPYEGRNEEAAQNMDNMLAEIESAVIGIEIR